MQKKTVYLLRHASIASHSSAESRYIGQSDIPLSALGMAQAEDLARGLADLGSMPVYCSDLKRSAVTAAIIAEKIAVKSIQRCEFREINLGLWEGRSFQEIAAEYPDAFIARGKDLANYRIPGGETFIEAQERAVAGFANLLLEEAESIILVGHAGINRLLLCKFLGVPITNMFRFSQDYGCINIITVEQHHYCIKLLNGRLPLEKSPVCKKS